jgi:hypothetical protein
MTAWWLAIVAISPQTSQVLLIVTRTSTEYTNDKLLKEDNAIRVTNAKQYGIIASPLEIEAIPEGSQHTWYVYEESHNFWKKTPQAKRSNNPSSDVSMRGSTNSDTIKHSVMVFKNIGTIDIWNGGVYIKRYHNNNPSANFSTSLHHATVISRIQYRWKFVLLHLLWNVSRS